MLYAYGVVREDVYVEKNALQLKGKVRVSVRRGGAAGGLLPLLWVVVVLVPGWHARRTSRLAPKPPPDTPTHPSHSQYVGQTSPQVSDVFAAAKGGTLFLDEAYALAGIRGTDDGDGRRDCFANDAIATLLTEAENNRTSVMVIMAGYSRPMDQLLDADPGG